MNPVRVLYEDNHLIAVIKPPGVLSQSDGSGAPDMLSLLSAELARKYNKPGRAFVGLIHRLDRNVGGVMFFAKTSKGASRASEDMRRGNFLKGYLAVSYGTVDAGRGGANGAEADAASGNGRAATGDASGNGWAATDAASGENCTQTVVAAGEGYLHHRLLKDEAANTVRESAAGKQCVLFYKHLCNIPPEAAAQPAAPVTSDIAARTRHIYFAVPITGRTHQIRAQFALSGAPLIGDTKYGNNSNAGKNAAAGEEDRFELGLWSVAASVYRTTARRERIWVCSGPEGRLWRGPDGALPGAVADFLGSDALHTLLIQLKEADHNEHV